MSQHGQQLPQSPGEGPQVADVWQPTVLARIAAHLPPNDVACNLRLLNKASYHQFHDRNALKLSERTPHRIFSARWSSPEACQDLTRKQREQLLCLVAASGDAENLQAALDSADFVPAVHGVKAGVDPVLDAAARAGHLDCCRLLVDSSRLPNDAAVAALLLSAAGSGHLHICEWCWEACPDLQTGSACAQAFERAAAGGHRAVCEACLLRNPAVLTWPAVIAAAKGGQASVLDWLLSLRPEEIGGRSELLWAALEGCDLTTAMTLSKGVDSQLLVPGQWAVGLHAALRSPTADWQAKAEWALRQGGIGITASGCYYEVAEGPRDPVDRFRWLKRSHIDLSDLSDFLSLNTLAEKGHLAAAEWLLGPDGLAPPGGWAAEPLTSHCVDLAAAKGNVAMLRALTSAGYAMSHRVGAAAASGGHLCAVRWLHETFGAAALGSGKALALAAARSGNAELMRWVRTQMDGAVYDVGAWVEAARSGCEAALELLAEWEVPMPTDGGPYVAAARHGDLRTLRVLLRMGVSFGPTPAAPEPDAHVDHGDEMPPLVAMDWEPEDAFIRAALRAPLAAVQWLAAAGCPVDYGLTRKQLAIKLGRDEREDIDERVLAWVEQQVG